MHQNYHTENLEFSKLELDSKKFTQSLPFKFLALCFGGSEMIGHEKWKVFQQQVSQKV